MTPFELEKAAQEAAEQRLADAADMMWHHEEGIGDSRDHPEWDNIAGPFCGCDTCIVREVIDAAWPYLKELAAVVEQEDTGHSKWSASGRAGSSPASGTSDYEEVQRLRRAIADHRVQWVEGINDAFAEDIRRINGRLWDAL